jgi:hypothetical protein
MAQRANFQPEVRHSRPRPDSVTLLRFAFGVSNLAHPLDGL